MIFFQIWEVSSKYILEINEKIGVGTENHYPRQEIFAGNKANTRQTQAQ